MKSLFTVPCLAALLSGCATGGQAFDYTAFRNHRPRSILVLPPLNETTEADATYGYLSTVTMPLAERGYYVFPVAVVDALFKENGLPTAGEMHQAPISKIREIIGADAVLYIVIESWGTSYQVLDSKTQVGARARLVETRNATTIWQGRKTVSHSASGAQQGLIGMLVAAIAGQIVNSVSDVSRDFAQQLNRRLVFDSNSGLLYGPYHPNYTVGSRR